MCARCYFSRPSAPEQNTLDEDNEIASILADAQQLKSLAIDYLHPEEEVKVDASAFGRNFFTRSSAPETEVEEEERAQILEDAKQLSVLALSYLCPEKPVVTSDPYATGRNFFTRPSAEEIEEDTDEKDLIMEEMKQLKKLAVDYMHPEKPVVTSDPYATGRNFFTRPSAEEQVRVEESEEEARVRKESLELKKLSEDYLHPERPVKSSGLVARNYFDRPSASGHNDHIHSQGHAINHSSGDVYDYHDHVLDLVNHDHQHGDDHSHQSEHFDMDEDALQAFRDNLHSTAAFKGHHPKEIDGEQEEEGNLSRSPSSVMLFELAM